MEADIITILSSGWIFPQNKFKNYQLSTAAARSSLPLAGEGKISPWTIAGLRYSVFYPLEERLRIDFLCCQSQNNICKFLAVCVKFDVIQIECH